jgi:ADP-ribose pyrophosphatase YjhB (NUDIX family)
LSYVAEIRSLVGQRKIFLAFASVVLRDDADNILLQHRTDFDCWGLPGGALEFDEDITSCARRELQEETGLKAGSLRLVGVYTDPRFDVTYPNGDQVQQFTICFEGHLSGGETRPDGVETKEQSFVETSALGTLDVPSWYRAMIHDALGAGPPAFAPPHVVAEPQDQILSVGKFIGSAGYIGVGASAVVLAEDGTLLAARSSPQEPWELPWVFCHVGENAAHAARRAFLEQAGIEIDLERIIGIDSSTQYGNGPGAARVKKVAILFLAHPVGGRGMHVVAGSAQVKWLAPQELLLRCSKHAKRFYQSAFAHLDGGYVVM